MEVSWVLLGLLPSSSKNKLSRKCVLLGLELARHCITITWLSSMSPTYKTWLKDISEWAAVEEVWIRHIQRDDKLEEDTHAWSTLLCDLKVSQELEPAENI
ncbi:hypothetical protein NDU88_006161 [Pleurodeles waltl]|uniref:Uncharacterized protein n=1 Tax=Pleurodeles waltl TaxID=8319 RepID=A0AAV7PPV7_PLEWA|nr:hypothetical protein NDU88_006161 [Pleurodeles waltl]